MFYVDCQGRLLDKYEPSVKEQRAVAFTSWNGHAFFYKSARTVAKCEPIGERARYRGERKPGETPEFKDWREWEGEVASGHFYAEDLEQVRRELLAEGHCPKVVMRSMSEWRCLRLRVRGREDCVISRPGCGGSGSPITGSVWRARRARSSFTFSRPAAIRLDLGKPCSRSRTISASCALPPSPQPRASWTTSFPCTSPSPRRPRISRPCASSATGTKRPWSPRTPRHWSRASAGGLTSSTWHRPDSHRSSSSSTATSRTTSATESTWSGAARTPWPMPSSRRPSSAPRTTWSKPARGTWRT